MVGNRGLRCQRWGLMPDITPAIPSSSPSRLYHHQQILPISGLVHDQAVMVRFTALRYRTSDIPLFSN